MFGNKPAAHSNEQTLIALSAIAAALIELNTTMIRMEEKIETISSVYQSMQR